MNSKVTAVVLAAGSSQRFGSDKRVAALPTGQGVLQQTIGRCKAAALELLVVLGPGDELLAQQLRHQGINTVIAANAAAGMGCSLAAAAAVVDEASAMLVVLADMPYVLSTTLRGIADRLGSGAAIVRPVYRGRGGNPVGFAPCFREQLMDLAGTVGARELLRIHAAEILHWQVDDPGIIHDIDYPADITWV